MSSINSPIARRIIRSRRLAGFALLLVVLFSFWRGAAPVAAAEGEHIHTNDALFPPTRPATLATPEDPRPSLYQPSAFLAGRVAVQVLFVESDGGAEPSTENWNDAQIAAIRAQVAAALDWWQARVPQARLTFDLTSRTVASRYEPIAHGLDGEGLWIGDALARLGHTGPSYFDQAYAADAALREARDADWASTIFVANSANDADGRFADDYFAYAYVGGPFLVITSDSGAYGTERLATVVAHELGHVFGALDQYAAAETSCDQRSGYLGVPTTNSQANNCGTHDASIMLDPSAAFQYGQVDASAFGQLGYRDSDGDKLPDPLDTAPTAQLTLKQIAGGRPAVSGRAVDRPFPAALDEPATINTIARIEYRADGGAWLALPALDGAYNDAVEEVDATLPLYDGEHTVELRAVNSVGGVSPITRQTLTVRGVGAAPDYAAEAPAYSNASEIALELRAPSNSAVQISENPFFAEARWAPVQARASWRLDENEGAHTLYVRFRDSNEIESAPLALTVVVDREAPTGRAAIRAGATPQLQLQAQDNISGVAEMQVTLEGQQPGAWQPYEPALDLPLGTSSAQVRIRDAAGNVSAPLAALAEQAIFVPLVSR